MTNLNSADWEDIEISKNDQDSDQSSEDVLDAALAREAIEEALATGDVQLTKDFAKELGFEI